MCQRARRLALGRSERASTSTPTSLPPGLDETASSIDVRLGRQTVVVAAALRAADSVGVRADGTVAAAGHSAIVTAAMTAYLTGKLVAGARGWRPCPAGRGPLRPVTVYGSRR